jgi:hypothetical protein
MMTVAWNPLGFYLADALPTGRLFDAKYYRDNIFTALIQLHPEPGRRQLVVHADSARPHIDQQCGTFRGKAGLRLVTHPLDSRHLAPSNFFLFRHVKNCFQGIVFQSHEESLA